MSKTKVLVIVLGAVAAAGVAYYGRQVVTAYKAATPEAGNDRHP